VAARSCTALTRRNDYGAAPRDARALQVGAASREGELVFAAGPEIFRFAADGELIDRFVAPAYTEEFPNDRDLEEFRNAVFLGSRPTEAAVRAFHQEPKRYAVRASGSLTFDDRGRLRVMTQRERDEYSWLDVYRGNTLLGRVRVRDRIYGFDLFGDLRRSRRAPRPDARRPAAAGHRLVSASVSGRPTASTATRRGGAKRATDQPCTGFAGGRSS
jgi:hypothetical protein